jgi:hypothetical protein
VLQYSIVRRASIPWKRACLQWGGACYSGVRRRRGVCRYWW